MATVPSPDTMRTSTTCAEERAARSAASGAPTRQRLSRQARVDLPGAGLPDAEGAVPQQQDGQRQQPADHVGKGGAQRRTRNAQPGTPDGDAGAEEGQRPGGVDEEKVEHDVQPADEDADEAGRQGVAGSAEHGGVHAHGHGEGEGGRPDGKVGGSVGLQREVSAQPAGQKAADADAEPCRRQTQDEVEEHGLPQHTACVGLTVGTEILRDLDGKGSVQPHQDAVEQPGAGTDDADGGRGFGPDVAHHGGVDVFHGGDDHLLQNGRDAQRQHDLRCFPQGDVLPPAHPGGELFE